MIYQLYMPKYCHYKHLLDSPENLGSKIYLNILSKHKIESYPPAKINQAQIILVNSLHGRYLRSSLAIKLYQL